MSNRLSKVIRRIERLPEREQSSLARYLESHLNDVLDEAKWTESFAKSSRLLKKMSREVDAAISSGDVSPLDPDKL